MEEENSNGQMESFIQVNGKMARNMVLDYGDLKKVTTIWGSGKWGLWKAKEFIKLFQVYEA